MGWNVKNCIFTCKKSNFSLISCDRFKQFFHNRSYFILLLFISCSNSIFPSIAFFFEPKKWLFSSASKVKLWQFQPIQFIACFVIFEKCWCKALAVFPLKFVVLDWHKTHVLKSWLAEGLINRISFGSASPTFVI